MARVKQTARQTVKPLITWTRFYLPREQEWPTWSVDHNDIHVGPLLEAEGGWENASLGRMVGNPEQAAYIIEWISLEALRNFQSSPACAAFLLGLPEDNPDTAQVSGVDSCSELARLTLDDASKSLATLVPASRFLTLQHIDPRNTSEVEGRVTFTMYMVPRKVDNIRRVWEDEFKRPFGRFTPPGSESLIAHPLFWYRLTATWFLVLDEDRWVEEKFGKLEPHGTQEEGHGSDHEQVRTFFCRFHLWSRMGATLEHEAASAADPQARESWDRANARVMPPATAWQQERWDIQDVPRYIHPSGLEMDPEEEEFERNLEEWRKEWREAHGEVGENSEGTTTWGFHETVQGT
ncbi:hypothetical protein C8A05DRAFT_48370 [Staphylotrichum tortipilum]|uniref:Uncharacterized protein n=1 Tax=Staphylotrichum tortipilum TaxID=2831512 RepID=A0AAN6MAQ2_9PEZI|nr:hypothetical protein C8A05DRAFT_48370 [Staphylotrichum longicolle]